VKYYDRESDRRAMLSHVRNKNIGIFPKNPSLSYKLLNRFSGLILTLLDKQLHTRNARLVVSERVIENPLVLRNLREDDRELIDFGAFESTLPLTLTALGYQVTVLDQRRYPFSHPNLEVLCGDIFDDDLGTTKKFDVVISISTIEHLGLGGYGDSIIFESADSQGVSILWSLLKPGGRLMASVPAGKLADYGDFRVYDNERLSRVFPNRTSTRWFMKHGREGVWLEVEGHETIDLVYSEPDAGFPAEAVAFVVCDRGV